MGMYTELVMAINIEKGTDRKVIGRLKSTFIDGGDDPDLTWRHRQDSYYFDGTTQNSFIHDDISGNWELTVRFNCKNYNSEIEKFLDWLCGALEIKWDKFVGYKRYEEADHPTLIYFTPTGVEYFSPRREPNNAGKSISLGL